MRSFLGGCKWGAGLQTWPVRFPSAIGSGRRRWGARLLNLLDPATAGLVHSNHAGVRSLAAAAAAELMGLPLAVTIHGSEFTSPALAHHLPVARAVCQRAAVVYSNSAFTAAAAMAHGVDRPIEVVHLGVDPERFHPGPVPAGFLACYDLAAEARRICRLAVS